MKQTVRVLSIDGGGVRGVFPTQILALLETKLKVDIYQAFDLIVGTSTGSIVAAAIVTHYSLGQLVEEYAEIATKIFRKRSNFFALFRSKYDAKPLADFLHTRLGDITLGEIDKPLIISATNVSIGDIYLFKSASQSKQQGMAQAQDNNVPLHKAVLASCSAPTYFDPVDINGTLVCDGGIWANNPALIGYTNAINTFPQGRIKVLSIGTGKAKRMYRPTQRWGLLNGWGSGKLAAFMTISQSGFPHQALQLVNPDTVFRIDTFINKYAIDDHQTIPALIESANSEFATQSQKLYDFLEL